MVGSSTAMGGPCAHKGTEGRNGGGGGGNGGRRGVVPWRPCSCALERRKGGDAMDREGAPCALPCALAAVAVEQGGRRAVAARKN
jgi:hypothetical protein